MGGRPHRVLYFWHSVGNGLLTLLSNMFTNLNLTDMETGYKVFRRDIIQVDQDRRKPIWFRAGNHRQSRTAGLPHLRGRHFLPRPDLRGRKKDQLEGRRLGALLHPQIQSVRRRMQRDPQGEVMSRGSNASSRNPASVVEGNSVIAAHPGPQTARCPEPGLSSPATKPPPSPCSGLRRAISLRKAPDCTVAVCPSTDRHQPGGDNENGRYSPRRRRRDRDGRHVEAGSGWSSRSPAF